MQRIAPESARAQILETKALKASRDQNKLRAAIGRLREDTLEGRNLIPAMIEATKAFATTGEIMGTVREAMGYPYDPMGVLENPFR